MHRRTLIALAALATAFVSPLALSQAKEVKIAIIASKTGPLEAYAKQTITGFYMGLNYATGGTMMVAGKKLVVIEKDDQGKPDVGKAALAAAYADDKVDIAVGPTCWWSPPLPTASPVTNGTSTSFAPAAIPARMPLPTPWRWTVPAAWLPFWPTTTPSAAMA